jgi:hypothetical protein
VATKEKYGVAILNFYYVKEGRLSEKDLAEMEDVLVVGFINNLIMQNEKIADMDMVATNKNAIEELKRFFRER